MKTWTVEQMLDEKPCEAYTKKRITDLWGGKKRLSLMEIMHLNIPDADKLWVAFRPKALNKKQTAAFLELVVTRAITEHALHCGISDVEVWAAKWLSGEDRSALSAWSAWSAARSAEAAAWSAEAAAWSAEAALSAEPAAWSAEAALSAEPAEYRVQVNDLIHVLGAPS